MQATPEAEARQHLKRSSKVFLAAAAAVVFGILLVYVTIGSVSGESSLLSNGALWMVLLCWFVIALVATQVWSRPVPQRVD